ncbi:MAG TPA: DegT/DnrJ/EryC1/StrS aminotransferase family protein [Candidatus Woesebacteria bacterium]|nr:DegT/DnrJ/EryC1/StrS aminotransferase family protein [Candidatus Woesebacteria bacterium]
MIKLIKTTFYNEDDTKKKLCNFIDKAEQLSFGAECLKFEKKFKKWHKRKHCIFVNSGSSANLAIIQALLNLGKIKKGDNVGFSALTWSTNTMPLLQFGLNAIPLDVELDTLNISSKTLLESLEHYPLKVLFLTNLLGWCDDIDVIQEICEKKKIIIIEDNCESLGSVYKGKLLGNYSFASSFSFYVGHHMSTIEGGAICTDNEELATMLGLVRAHGWDRNLSERRQIKIRNKYSVNSTFYSRYTFYDLGFNLRPMEINAFIGNIQIGYLDEIVKIRKQNFLKMAPPIYEQVDKYYPLRYDHMDLLSNFAIPVICKSREIRDELVKKCNGVLEIRPIVGGDMTQQPFFGKYMKNVLFKNPNAKLAHEQGLYFGNNPELTESEMRRIVELFTK